MNLILVVDDEGSFTLALELALTASGFRVDTASSGEEGLLKASQSRPDLILLDNMMPGIGGLETLNLVRSQENLKDIPVIMMSGATPFVTRSQRNWNEFLLKPFTIDEVVAAIKKYI